MNDASCVRWKTQGSTGLYGLADGEMMDMRVNDDFVVVVASLLCWLETYVLRWRRTYLIR